jgi:hypothetical protein
MTFRVQFGNGQAVTTTEEYADEQAAEVRAAEVCAGGVRYVVIYEVDGEVCA